MAYSIRLIEALAIPRNSRKPNMSVTVVTTTAEETAGSMPIRRRNNGTPAPTEPAIIMLPSIAIRNTRPRPMFCFHRIWANVAIRSYMRKHPAASDRPEALTDDDGGKEG